MRIFISHSSANAEISEKMCKYLEENGHSCFFAPRDIRSGFPYAEEIMNGLDNSNAVILVLSEKSNESPHVLREVERAVSLGLPIIVFKTEEVALTKSMEYFLMSHQWLNNETDSNFSSLLSAVNVLEQKETSTEIKTENHSNKSSGASFIAYVAVFIGAVALVVLLIIFFAGGDKENNLSSPAESSGNGSDATETTSDTSKIENESVTVLESGTVAGIENVKEGDTVILGTYNGEPIEWRILSIDGRNALVVSDKILTIKCYDAAESGKYNYVGNDDYWGENISELPMMTQKKLRGSNQWHLSNIRTWLNSDRENVKYNDQPPTSSAMSGMANGYDKEAGFLNGFTKEEKSVILPTPITTNNVEMDVTTDDLVFLLSKEELALFDKADVSIAAKPTEKAAQLDKSGTYKSYSLDLGVEDHHWWLRDNGGAAGYEGYLVTNSKNGNAVISYAVGVEGFGIRPAMTIKLSAALNIQSKN